jgi:hypothetical protein
LCFIGDRLHGQAGQGGHPQVLRQRDQEHQVRVSVDTVKKIPEINILSPVMTGISTVAMWPNLRPNNSTTFYWAEKFGGHKMTKFCRKQAIKQFFNYLEAKPLNY